MHGHTCICQDNPFCVKLKLLIVRAHPGRKNAKKLKKVKFDELEHNMMCGE
jgi:hypothetical protein